ncbi:hypothetical protein NBH00_12640 [Paraconexibacter antarcticus]|uniref:Uncharacterized protein n=1 Tax=Paraconexibacter antarcticus TaxID=2949664 RepID=A0ABY5DYC0_9ACTN|nr:hypothetical protein [Paraconexibacter antarcticus]UTI67025.1 hypothetical protein NBH00_12640 [Paraconexibacter antarcticus]
MAPHHFTYPKVTPVSRPQPTTPSASTGSAAAPKTLPVSGSALRAA